LKPENIVVEGDGTLQIIDYGLMRNEIEKNMTRGQGTLFYQAPEMLIGVDDYNSKGPLQCPV
jgi:serine/threonine protein kinase